jgi:hypothetical protein
MHLSSQLHGNIKRRITVQASPRHKCQALFEKYLKQKGLKAWLKG